MPQTVICGILVFCPKIRPQSHHVAALSLAPIYRNALYIDESAKKLSFVQFDTEEKLIYDFRELKECLVLNNGAAAISAADFLTAAKPLSLSLSLRVTTSNIQHPAYEIPLITSSTDQASDEYREKMKFAQELYTAITNIINQN